MPSSKRHEVMCFVHPVDSRTMDAATCVIAYYYMALFCFVAAAEVHHNICNDKCSGVHCA